MAKVVIKLNRSGIRYAALKSPKVRAEVSRYAQQVGENASGSGKTVTVGDAGISRARTYVWLDEPNSAQLEAKYRILGRALGQGGE